MSDKIENPFAAPEPRDLATDVPVVPVPAVPKRTVFQLGELVSVRPELLPGAPVAMMVTGRRPLSAEVGLFELTVSLILRLPSDAYQTTWDLQARTLSLPETAFVPYVAREAKK